MNCSNLIIRIWISEIMSRVSRSLSACTICANACASSRVRSSSCIDSRAAQFLIVRFSGRGSCDISLPSAPRHLHRGEGTRQ
jgi:hypothetical protein